jgi:hypothetical protein
MKTAMQMMLEWTRKTFPMDLDTPRMIESKIESLLEKEKENIEKAYIKGIEDERIRNYPYHGYYNETYK